MTSPYRLRFIGFFAALCAPLAACQGPEVDSAGKPALTGAQAQALSDMGKMFRRSGPLPTTRVPGGISVDLQGGYQHAVMARANPDGTYSLICTDSIDAATEFLTRGTAQKADEK